MSGMYKVVSEVGGGRQKAVGSGLYLIPSVRAVCTSYEYNKCAAIGPNMPTA